ncbi:MAG: hypothetical protein NVSMB1_00520 [Polyangiales bacterium]
MLVGARAISPYAQPLGSQGLGKTFQVFFLRPLPTQVFADALAIMEALYMRRGSTSRFGLALLISMVLGLSSFACAKEREAISRVQANALPKSFFVGKDLLNPKDDPEFYMRNTVVDVPYGATQEGLFTASYAQPLSSIKWEITAKSLVARQTYERIKDSDHKGSRRTSTGQVVAMFSIEKHFDVRRGYNVQTGEETNLVEENDTDRPWYTREYMRVDWSTNLVTDGYEVDTLSQLGIEGGVKFDPVAYYVQDPTSPDAPTFAISAGYFDVTTKAFATPQLVETPYGSFPACYLEGVHPAGNCNATELTLRLSFKTVVDNDYEATDQDGRRQEAFGWFTVDRFGYERNYGILDEKWHRFMSKYNVWLKSHVEGSQCAVDQFRDEEGRIAKYSANPDPKTGLPVLDPKGEPHKGTPIGADPHRDDNKNGTEDECEFTVGDQIVNPGSRCDEFAHKCTIPLYKREIRTIPWYYGLHAPADLYKSTAIALGQWNLAVKRALQIGRSVEAKRVGAKGEFVTDEGLLDADGGKTVADVFVLCHNPVVDGDHPACDRPGTVARLGDIRYNVVNIIDAPQSFSPWGIMVDADDPLTGEKVSTSVNEWAHVLDIASQGTEDLVRWLNGEISDDQVMSGKFLRDWANASSLGTAAHVPSSLSTEEINSRISSIDTSLSKLNGLKAADAALPKELQRKMASETLSKNLGPSLDAEFEAKRHSLIGTKYEAMLVTPEMLVAAGMDPKTPVAGDNRVLSKASPLRGMNPGLKKWVSHMRDKATASHATCRVSQPEPDGLVGLARQASKQFPLPNKSDPNYAALKHQRDADLHQWLREQFHISVIAHEMGHSMGLRHNFTGSYDALNYHTEYWQLRTRNGKEHYCGSSGGKGRLDAVTRHDKGEDCVGPRWVDPLTEEETNGLIWKWGSTTVMDYPGDPTQDMNGIGPYDKAAMRFGYADVVDVDTDTKLPSKGVSSGRADKASAYVFALDGFGGIGGSTIGSNHYSTYADKFGILGNCGPQSDPKNSLSAKCSGPPLDYVARRDMRGVGKYGDAALAHLPETLSGFAVDPQGRVRHPYMFGSDEYADYGNVPVFRFDAGADSYEQFQYLISTYENRYIFEYFRRDRVGFSPMGAIDRAQSRYFDKIAGMTKSLALMVGFSQDANASLNDPGDLMPLGLGAADGLSLFARVLTRPEPGNYQRPDVATTPIPFAKALSNNYIVVPDGDFRVSLGSGEGRYLHNDYDYTQGYYWGEYLNQVGSYYDKVSATYYLTEAYNSFISNAKEDFIDGRYKNLNYSTLYPNQVRRLFANIMQDDPMTYGPFVVAPGGKLPKGTAARVRYFPWDKYDAHDQSTIDLDYPVDAVVLDPLVGWQEQYPALIAAFQFGTTTLTMDFLDQLRIYTAGGPEAVAIAPSEQLRYRDPATGIQYIARTYGEEIINKKLAGKVQKSIGARMIQYANQIAARTYKTVGLPDAVTGELTYERDKSGNLVCIDPSSCIEGATKVKNFSSNLDLVRELTLFFGVGPRP